MSRFATADLQGGKVVGHELKRQLISAADDAGVCVYQRPSPESEALGHMRDRLIRVLSCAVSEIARPRLAENG